MPYTLPHVRGQEAMKSDPSCSLSWLPALDTPPRLEPAEDGGFSSFTFGENGHYSCPVQPGWSPTSDPSHQDSAAISSDFWIYMGSFYLCTLAHLEPPPHLSL
ncbi:unnamed protein product [Rangifer tarandus platyrhynchus]|uniref:Uncharacterized protein n=1 Tax=Rangifer tarandus platyrhynchus TaxID=3082113 RepID=A0ABN8YUZ9_RANTA|nr:unnamed protein product [Rangifer tarandus platyrhynchus]